jgi:glucose/arabinose dehydrogenase
MNITEIRPIFNAGWSAQPNKNATTWFDDVYMIRLGDENLTSGVPIVTNDPNLKIEVVAEGLEEPTSMSFLGPNDILVLEKNNGTVRRIINDTIIPEPVLDLNVGNLRERGLLGIAIAAKNESASHSNGTANTGNSTHVFLYLTESKNGDTHNPEPLSNHLYRYDLENNKLVNPKLLLELPITAKSIHNGGIVVISPDDNVYTAVGDLEGQTSNSSTKAQNYRDGPEPDGRSGILRMTQDGQPVNDTVILGDKHPLDLYYAYGIRNSYGMDFDPITGKLWNTENGPSFGDEINLVEPGFNSGWQVVTGKLQSSNISNSSGISDTLEDFDGKGLYSDPEYEWSETVGPTALKFLTSDKLGKQYENDMFVADFNKGNVYHFELNKERTKLIFDSAFEGRLNEKLIFAKGFADGITDIEVGPDGYLYIVSYGQGKIFRIVPTA